MFHINKNYHGEECFSLKIKNKWNLTEPQLRGSCWSCRGPSCFIQAAHSCLLADFDATQSDPTCSGKTPQRGFTVDCHAHSYLRGLEAKRSLNFTCPKSRPRLSALQRPCASQCCRANWLLFCGLCRAATRTNTHASWQQTVNSLSQICQDLQTLEHLLDLSEHFDLISLVITPFPSPLSLCLFLSACFFAAHWIIIKAAASRPRLHGGLMLLAVSNVCASFSFFVPLCSSKKNKKTNCISVALGCTLQRIPELLMATTSPFVSRSMAGNPQ